jgi:hypothetical protein
MAIFGVKRRVKSQKKQRIEKTTFLTDFAYVLGYFFWVFKMLKSFLGK